MRINLLRNFSMISVSLLLVSALSVNASQTPDNSDLKSTRTIKIDKPFTGVVASTGYQITYISNDNPPRAIITGEKSYIDNMEWFVDSEGCLHFVNKKDTTNSKQIVEIALNGDVLTTYSANSSGCLKVVNVVETEKNLCFRVSSAGKIFMGGVVRTYGDLDLQASSSGEINFLGVVYSNKYNSGISSTAKIKVARFEGKTMNVKSSSRGMTTILSCLAESVSIDSSSSANVALNRCDINQLLITSSSQSKTVVTNCTADDVTISASSESIVTCEGITLQASFKASSAAEIEVLDLKIGKITDMSTTSGANIRF